MLAYVLRRLVIALVAIFILATITFFLLRLVPGDPFAGPRITTEVKERLRAHYGLDRPLIEQYLIYMANLAQGDFGYSLDPARPPGQRHHRGPPSRSPSTSASGRWSSPSSSGSSSGSSRR